jgi:nicotinate-nucleotide adenylyltransferase
VKKVGILGGTFDPFHNGHLAIAGESVKRLGLEKVLFIPAGYQPLKQMGNVETVENRLNMVSLSIEHIPYFELSTIETDANRPSYTVDTLKILKKQFQRNIDLYFILGWDSLEELPLWKNPREVIELCHIVAFTRINVAPPDVEQLDRQIPGLQERLIMIEMEPIDISSTDIRRRLSQGLSIHGLVPQKVEDYIISHRLYI